MSKHDPPSDWYVSDRGTEQGPYSTAAIVRKVVSGELGDDLRVWRPGWTDWQPLGDHFKRPFKDAEPAAPAPPTSPEKSESKVARLTRWAALAGAVVLATGALLVRTQLDDTASAIVAFSLWLATTIPAAASMLAGAWFWQRHFRALQLSRPRRSAIFGLYRVACVGVGTTAVLAAAVVFATLGTRYRLLAARDAFRSYEYQVDAVASDIAIRGTIGPGLNRRIEASLRALSHIRTITITSPGGLVDEALAIASTLASHPDVTVTARHECDSACTIVLVAGKRRLADWNLLVRFHAVAPVVPFVGFDALAFADLRAESDAFLLRHGVPRWIVDAANARGPDSFYGVSAVRLAEEGVISGLLNGNAEVSVETAKWMNLEQALKGEPEAPVFAAIGSAAPEFVHEFAEPLFHAAESHDTTAFAEAAGQMIRRIVPRVIESAESSVVFGYMEASRAQIDQLAETEAWQTCTSFMATGTGTASARELSRQIANRKMEALAAAVRSAASSGWAVRPIAAWAEAESTRIVRLGIARLAVDNLSLADIDHDSRAKCIWNRTLFDEFGKAGPDRGVMAFRWLSKKASN